MKSLISKTDEETKQKKIQYLRFYRHTLLTNKYYEFKHTKFEQ